MSESGLPPPDFRLSGQLRMSRDGVETVLGVTLLHRILALLLWHANSPVNLSTIINSVWSAPGEASEDTLRTYIVRLRKLVKGTSARIATRPGAYLLEIDAMRVDVLRFAALLERADADPTSGRECLDEAMRACPTDRLLEGFDGDWVMAARREHQARWRLTMLRRNRYWLDAGEHESLLSVLRREDRYLSLDQKLAQHYLLALYRSGFVREAVAHYQQLYQRLTNSSTPISAALRLLGERIERQDVSLLHDRTAAVAPPPDMLPAQTGYLEGRQKEIREIEQRTGDGRKVAVVGIYGGPGVGKTSLATAYAHRYKRRYAGGVLFARLNGIDVEQNIDNALDAFLLALAPGETIPAVRAARLARYRDLVRDKPTLVVLDDVSSVEEVVPLLPTCPGSVVLVTGRRRMVALTSRHGAFAVVLGRIDQPSAVALLRRLAGHRADWSHAAATEIAHECGGHPLALCLAGARLATRPEEPMTAVVKALAAPGQQIPTLDEYAEESEKVNNIIGSSYRLLGDTHAWVFRLFGLSPCPSLDVPAVARLAGITEVVAQGVLAELAEVHLVQVEASNRYSTHDLITQYAAAQAVATDSDVQRSTALDRLYDHLRDEARRAAHTLWPREVPAGPPNHESLDAAAARAWLDAHRADIVAALQHPSGQDRPAHVVDLANSLWRYLDHGGYLDHAVALQRLAADAAGRLNDQRAARRALERLGAALLGRGELDQAEAVLRNVLDLCRLTGDADGQAGALGNLGRVAMRRGAYTEAVTRQTAALAIFRELGDRLAEARTLTNLGIVHRLRSDYKAALRVLDEAATICRTIDAPDATARVLAATAGVLRFLGRHEEAEDQYLQAMAGFRALGDRIGEASALTHLGLIHSDRGRSAQSIEQHQAALEIFTEIGHETGRLETLLHLGSALRAAGQVVAALGTHTEALTRAQTLGDEGQVAQAHAELALDHAARAERGMADAVPAARNHLAQALARFRALDIELPAHLARLGDAPWATDPN